MKSASNSTDQQERARVRSRIGSLILEYCRNTPIFYMEDLRWFVVRKLKSTLAPASTDRILRQLRQDRRLNYKVVSRHRSLYQVIRVERPAEQAGLFASVS